ncbi:MAG: hypothetical protein CVU39_10905 [Chloroflexi bacterium HGW-Chloroflexi-10]|nr:MAG: hypothetical protein CVU39_10905 [Chloroflexi bacterium HGW-Chloroflexi-10]
MKQDNLTTLVFDWGDTLMIDDPHSTSKMVDWPQVHAVEGAAEMLATLKPTYRIALATNAAASTREEVRAALARVGLDTFIDIIFTRHELGAGKPAPQFYQNIQLLLNAAPHELMMIGDSYQRDILPAWRAGWHTFWYNPNQLTAPAHTPVHTLETAKLSGVPAALENLFLPSIQTSLEWYIQEGATFTLLAHVQMVAAAAYLLSTWYRDAGFEIDPLLAHRGGLLHDVQKLSEKDGQNHAELAFQFLNKRDQPALAEIARRHLMGDLHSDILGPQTWEEKIVNYVDKLTEGSQLVSLTERLSALQMRYPNFAERIRKNTAMVQSMENEVVSQIGKTPEEVLSLLKHTLFNGFRD